MTFEHNDELLRPNIPVNERTIQLFNELHVLCRQKQCNYHLSYSECGNEWDVTLEEPGGRTVFCNNSSLIEYALESAVEKLKKWDQG